MPYLEGDGDSKCEIYRNDDGDIIIDGNGVANGNINADDDVDRNGDSSRNVIGYWTNHCSSDRNSYSNDNGDISSNVSVTIVIVIATTMEIIIEK